LKNRGGTCFARVYSCRCCLARVPALAPAPRAAQMPPRHATSRRGEAASRTTAWAQPHTFNFQFLNFQFRANGAG
jgi:hypothetical protein